MQQNAPAAERHTLGTVIGKLARINLWATCRINLRAGTLRKPRIFIFSRFSLIQKKGAVIVSAPGSQTRFNESWYGRNRTGSVLCLREKSTLILKGKNRIYRNADISVSPGGTLELDTASININAQIHCANRISIGPGTLIGEGVRIRDHDVHRIVRDGKVWPADAPIVIGSRVWVGINVTILKGVTIGDGAIVSSHSLVTRDIPARALAGGVPARVIREDVEWLP